MVLHFGHRVRQFRLLSGALLIWMTLHNAVYTIFVRYTRIRTVEIMYSPTIAVFWTELIKLIMCFSMVTLEERSLIKAVNEARNIFSSTPFSIIIPSFLYTISNNLYFVAATYLDSATFAVTSNLKFLATAAFCRLLLQKFISPLQWISLIILVIGISLVQCSKSTASDTKMLDFSYFSITNLSERLIGLGAIVIACLIGSFAGVYIENSFKKSSDVAISLWMWNVHLSLSSLPFALITIYTTGENKIDLNDFLRGFDRVVWFLVVWCSVGGLLCALCIKYTDNIRKNLALSATIIISTVASIYIFNFQPTLYFGIGAVFVISAIIMYAYCEK